MKFLAPAHAPATVLPEWLAGQYKDAAKGDLVLVDYKYDDVDPEFTGRTCTLRTLSRLRPMRISCWKAGSR